MTLSALVSASKALIKAFVLLPLARLSAAKSTAPLVGLVGSALLVAALTLQWLTFDAGALFVASLTFYEERVLAEEQTEQ